MNPKASNSARYAILSGFAVVILYPFALMIFGSLKTETAFLANPVSPPTTIELRNYQFAWSEAHIPKFALNSLIVSTGTVLLTLVTGSMAAFALSRIRFRGPLMDIPGRSSLLLTVPVQIYIIPLYIIIVRAHLSDSLVGLILPYTTGSLPLAVFLLKTYFDQLPSEVMDAARLDGCSKPDDLAEGSSTTLSPSTVNRCDLHFCGNRGMSSFWPWSLFHNPRPTNVAPRSTGVFS